MTASVTIKGVTTPLYSTTELDAVLSAKIGPIGLIDGVKAKYKIPTYRLFAAGKVMVAPDGFTWRPGLTVATTVEMQTLANFFDKAYVDDLVASLS